MVCWQIANIPRIIKVLILFLILLSIIDVSVASEHAISLVVTIRVIHLLAIAIWLHLAA